MVVMTMIGRVIDGLPLAASMQSDQDVCMQLYAHSTLLAYVISLVSSLL